MGFAVLEALELLALALLLVRLVSAHAVLHAVDFSTGARVTVVTILRSVRVYVCVISGTSGSRVVAVVEVGKRPGIGNGGHNPGMGGPPHRKIGPIPR